MFQNGTGLIEIWFDESDNGDSSAYAIPEIIISKDAIGNAYDVTDPLTHSADLLTEQEIFQTGQCLLASCTSPDLSPFLLPGSIPRGVPEPGSMAVFGLGLAALYRKSRRVGPRLVPGR